MPSRRPVVTGLGIISAAGHGVEAVWRSLENDRPGLGPLTLFSSPRYANHLVGQVRENVHALARGVRGSRSDKLAWLAAREAAAQAKLSQTYSRRVGVMLGASVGGMAGTEQFLATLLREKKHRCGPLRFHECATATDLCARWIGAGGPCATFSTACSAGALAIFAGAECIAQDEADVMLVGASDSLCRLTLNGFGSLLLLDAKGCRPFDALRAGISLGEGAAMLVLEAEETARARGAKILARLDGWGASCDAFHATAPEPEGRGALAAMQNALACAGLTPDQIDFVSAHGTATPDNDIMEGRALQKIFGGHVPPFSSVKPYFGHTLAASGALKAVVAVQSLVRQAVPGTPSFGTMDPKIGLEPLQHFSAQPVTRILSNSFGFGGNNVALVFSRAENEPFSRAPASPRAHWFPILAAGCVTPVGNSPEAAAATIRAGNTNDFSCANFGEEPDDGAKRRKASRLQQMTLAAVRQCLTAPVTNPICAIIGTGLGSLADTAAFVENMILKDERAPRPSLFTTSVHNAAASQTAIEFGLTAMNSTPVQHGIAFETALWQGATELANGRAVQALVGAADELNHYVSEVRERWKIPGAAGEGCAVFLLGQSGANEPSRGSVSAIRLGRDDTDSPQMDAEWILETLRRDGIAPHEIDLILTNHANPDTALAGAFSALAGKIVPAATYLQHCGEHHSASAFGFLHALAMVRGEIPAPQPCRKIVLLTKCPTGTKGMCCVRA